MATWASSLDVLADLDRLSEFSSGVTPSENFEILSSQSYGRGNSRTEERPPQHSSAGKKVEDPPFLPVLPSFSPGTGRGERILALTRHRQDQSLQRQLRMAMGPGYSNELIEDFIRGDSSSDQSSEVGQFDDHDSLPEEPSTESTVLQKEESDSSITSLSSREPRFTPVRQEKEVETSLKETNPIVDNITTKELAKQKKKPVRCRNALLNNLPNYNNPSIIETETATATATVTVTESENKTPSPKRDVRNSCDKIKSVSPFNKYKAEESGLAREMQSRVSPSNIPNWLRRDHGFVYKENDFPPL